jgi:hypothetical protein
VQPDTRTRAPFALWGVQTIQPDAARTLDLPLGFRLAGSLERAMVLTARWRRGDATSEDVRAAIRARIAATVEGWDERPRRRRLPRNANRRPRPETIDGRPAPAPLSRETL